MRSFIAVLVAVAAGSLSVGACSSDSSPGDVVDVAQCVGVYSDLTQAMYNRKAQPDLGCSSDSDLTNTCTNDLTTIAATCGRSCLNVADPDAAATCVSKCVDNNLPSALSDSCMACYTTDVACARELCFAECVSATSPRCTTCRVEQGCAGTFYTCSGLPIPTGLDLGNGAGGATDGAAAGAGGADAGETPAAGAGGS